MPALSPDTDTFITEFDAAIEAHMEWTRRILRCAVLHTSPGEDVLSPVAHTLCRFGRWFLLNREHFDTIDVNCVERIEVMHQKMHDAIRLICSNVIKGKPGEIADLEAFEHSQSDLLSALAKLKTLTLSNAARHDPLTGLPLRYGIESDFTLCRNDAQRNRTLLFVVMIDADHFKRINDNYGHPAGDAVLRHMALTLKLSRRNNDPLYRFGGEEFLLLMRCASVGEARQSAERIVNKMRTTPVPITDGKLLKLTVTLGLAQVGEQEDIDSAIKRADAALYEGKGRGRDCYVISDT
jgi:diguanylate cyclase (GGDEF)-like protein